MNTDLVTRGELATLRSEFRSEIAAVRREIWMTESRRRAEMRIAKARAAWRPGLGAYGVLLFVHIVGNTGIFYWFAKLLGH
jgi:hypothetical protein